MTITFLGTTTLLFDDGKDQILFDAHLSRPSIMKMLFCKLKTDQKIVDSILKKHPVDRLKGIFISHSHYDHVLDMPYISNKTGAHVYGSESTLNIGRGGDVPEERLHCFIPGQEITIGDFKIKVFASKHSKAAWFNNDIGQKIEKPLRQPATRKDFKEGGSFDFLITNGGKSYLIRPSFNYVENELNGVNAYIVFLGVAGLAKASKEVEEKFFHETVEKVKPAFVVPIHWENFMVGLNKPIKKMPRFIEHTDIAMYRLAKHCEENNVTCFVQLPLTRFEA